MGAREDAGSHVRKAREFLEAAGMELELYTAAASSSVLAGINAKDAICLRLTGRTRKPDDHRSAVPELAAAGPAGKALESTFRRHTGPQDDGPVPGRTDRPHRRHEGGRVGSPDGRRRTRCDGDLTRTKLRTTVAT